MKTPILHVFLGTAVLAAMLVGGPANGQTTQPAAAGTGTTPGTAAHPADGSTLGKAKSFIHGLFGSHGKAPDSTAAGDNPGAPPSGMDCDKIAAMPGSGMTADSCRKLMASQQAYRAAASDPGAQRPGDEQMTCEQITAELRNQHYAAPDQAKLADAQQAARQQRAVMARQQAEAHATAATQQVELNAAIAADKATEAASGGLVQGRAAMATQQAQLAKNKAEGERMLRQSQPAEQHMTSATANLATDAGAQMTANPRLARLIQLANEKHCQGGQ